jgi:antimicrobial peptide system SdpB family protein
MNESISKAGSGNRFLKFWTTEHGLIGIALFRILTGLCTTYGYLVHYYQRHYLWGPAGVVPLDLWRESGAFSLYGVSSSQGWFEVTFHVGILSAILWTVGWKSRFTGLVAFLFRYSLYARNTLIAHGGDNVSIIIQAYLLFANTGAYFSVDARHHRDLSDGKATTSFGKQAAAVSHNAALIASVLQLCVMYTVAGLHKVSGPMWQSGTALYYILRTQQFGSPHSYLIDRNAYLLVILSYATICFQVGFCLALLNPYSRYLWIAGGIAFHVGIAFFMGLTTFSWLMIATYPLLVRDTEYRRIQALSKDSWHRATGLPRRYRTFGGPRI